MIPDTVVDEVRMRADIVEVVGRVVDLKKSGSEYKGKCPFHEDRTPSFYVIPAKDFYNCFGCQESGDVFTFVMKTQGLDFVDAVKEVGARFGVDVQEVRGQRPEEDPNRPLYEANAFARDFFITELKHPERGAGARAYLERRGISEAIQKRFDLGYAPDSWDALRSAADTRGLDREFLLQLGLLKRSERRPDPYDALRDRVVFPIEDLAKRVIGFGGRVLRQGQNPKYLNSSESAIYTKGLHLYALGGARNAIRKEGAALVVEGYMDVVALAAAGLDTAVAALGTAMTRDQAKLLRRFTTRVFLLFDSDTAGQKATFRTGDLLLAEGIQPSVVTLPPGEDPDSVVQKSGASALRGYLDQAVDVLDRKMQMLEERGYFERSERIREAVDRLLPTLRAVVDPTMRDIYIDRVATRTGVQRNTLADEVARTPRPTEDPYRARRAPTPALRTAPSMGAERDLLHVLARNRDWIERAAERIGPEHFDDSLYRRIFEELTDDPDLTGVPTGLDPATTRRFEEILGDSEPIENIRAVFDACIARMKGVTLRRQIEALDARMERAHADEAVKLLSEKARVAAELREMDENWSRTLKPREDRGPGEMNER